MIGKKYYLGVVRMNSGITLLCRYFHEEQHLVNAVTGQAINNEDLASSEFNALHEQPATYSEAVL
jgi:hypothetical protein